MASEINILLDELEARIEKLKILYEQYFMGLDKLEPTKERQEVARIVRRIQTAQTTNTALRFRLNSLNQRFMSYQNYWNRIQREIENGTYHRDLARVERDMKRRGIDVGGLAKLRNKGELEAAIMQSLAEEAQAKPAAEPAAEPAARAAVLAAAQPPPVPRDGLVFGPPSGEHPGVQAYTLQDVPGMAQRGRMQPPPLPTAGKPPPPPPPTPPSSAATPKADERMQRLYQAYVSAKQRTGEATDGLTYDRLVRTLQKQVPAIQKKTGCRRVDFKIEIRDGKAVLKAVPRK